MAENVEQQQQQQQQQHQQRYNNPNDVKKVRKSPECQMSGSIVVPASLTRERSFVRTTSQQQNNNKRRSLAFNIQPGGAQTTVQMRGKPAIDIYRPPNVRMDCLSASANKLNVHAQEFTLQPSMRAMPSSDALSARASMVFAATSPANVASSGGAIQHQEVHFVSANRRLSSAQHGGHRSILVTHAHPLPMNHMAAVGMSQQIPLVHSPSNGNILHANINRVKFAAEPQKLYKGAHLQPATNNLGSYGYHQKSQQAKGGGGGQYVVAANNGSLINGGGGVVEIYNNNNNNNNAYNVAPLQRSKSLSSADALTRGIAGLGLALANEVTDIGQFTPEIQALIDTALGDPNKLNARRLMELTSHFIKRAVEGRRYALPIARLCLNIIAREQQETFLEALLNTCRQWYQEREKLLYTIQGMKSPSRIRFTAFMAFLTEMFCQLKRRQLQLHTQCDGAPPPLVLLTLLSKCCEDCVRPPVRSLSEIECLFYVLTCIGHDMENQLPQQLEILLSLVRDAFLNANDSAPAIRRTLLQLIELQASHWQLPGNTVLYYYPSTK